MTPAQAVARIIKLEDFAMGLAIECNLLRRAIETMHEPYLVELTIKREPNIPDPPKVIP